MGEESEEFKRLAADFSKFNEEMKNPLVVGALLNKLSEERASTNLLFKEINAKLDRVVALENRMSALEEKLETRQPVPLTAESHTAPRSKPAEVLLAEIDEQIVNFVKKTGKASAEEVQKQFGYRGRNAASARLNRLCGQGVLQKRQVGRKVYFVPA